MICLTKRKPIIALLEIDSFRLFSRSKADLIHEYGIIGCVFMNLGITLSIRYLQLQKPNSS